MDYTERHLQTFYSKKVGVEISNETFPGGIHSEILITNDTHSNPWIIFKDIIFHNFFSITNAHLRIGIGFTNCEFRNKVKIENVTCTGSDIKFNDDSKSIFFTDCTFNKEVTFTGNRTNIERDLVFENCRILNQLTFSHILVGQSLKIQRSTINDKVDFDVLRIKMGLHITSTRFDKSVKFDQGHYSTISISQSTFKADLKFWNCYINGSLTFNDGECESGVSLTTIKAGTKATLNIIGGKYKESFNILYQSPNNQKVTVGFKYLFFRSCDFVNGLNVIGAILDPPLIEKILLRISAKMQGDISFTSLHVGIIEISGINSKATIKLDDIDVNEFEIEKFYNHSNFLLSRINPSLQEWNEEFNLENGKIQIMKRLSTFSIQDSNLGKAQFFSINLDEFSNVWLRNVGLSEITTSGIKWFSDEKLFVVSNFSNEHVQSIKKHYGDIPKNNVVLMDFRARLEIYRQLKLSCEKQGDRFQSLEFHKREMLFYRKNMEIVQPGNWNDRLVMLSGLTNNFGQSWLKATWLGFLFTFIFFIPIALLGSENLKFDNTFCICKNTGDIFIEILKQFPKYFQLLNPTHNLSNIYDLENKTEWIHFFDFLHRLVNAFFIFQIISAFRKLIK